MNERNSLTIDFERRWHLAAGILSILGVVLFAGALLYGGSSIPAGDGGAADVLTGIDGHRSAQVIASVMQGLGYMLLAAPLVFLFKAAAARAPQVKTGLIGVLIIAPLFLGTAAITSAFSNLEAATTFKNDGPALVQECVGEKATESGDPVVSGDQAPATDDAASAAETVEQIKTDCADDVASDAQDDAGLRGLSAGLGLAGILGLAIGIVYTALWSMRTGLLSRFWGSLGMASGAVSVIIPLFVLFWFIYIGLLLAGRVPGGRPPAWAAGVAMPWPDPRAEAAAAAEAEAGDKYDDVIEGSAEDIGAAGDFPDGDDSPPGAGSAPQIERRKRKKRNS